MVDTAVKRLQTRTGFHVDRKSDRRVDPWWRSTWPISWTQFAAFVASYLGLTLVFTATGKLLTGPLKDGAIVHRDETVAQWFADRRTSARTHWSAFGSDLAETIPKIALTAIAVVVLLLVWRRWLEPLLLASSLILEASVFITVTVLVGRNRPDVVPLENSPVNSSYPSGHVAAAVVYGAGAVIVFWHTRKWMWRAAFVALVGVVVLAVAIARMYRGMHFLSDVVAGAVLGALSVTVATVILSRTEQGRAVRARHIARELEAS